VVAPIKELTASRLSTLIDEVTRNPIYRNNARYFQKIIAERNGLSLAADILELAFGLTQKRSVSLRNSLKGKHHSEKTCSLR
jgi:UDP:flavonoid glycosyltransferase YjiC (YdhE family)